MAAITEWLNVHYVVTYFIIYVFMAYVYTKVFKVRKLPILKELIIYLVIGVGAMILASFQLLLELPIVYSLTVAILLMFMVRIRYFFEKRQKR
ncbi:YlaH-like family protein [Paenibacillus psychroresistens]|uniref:YlaH-like family protein n=1 Tax=Paenibacillus psychroresistens TaxID=1778678 RepID=UPI001D03A863|nr:YlaH-like family protein [Paenibacillus psychroresistens]